MPDADPATILFVRRGYSAYGGAERYLRRLAEALQNIGYPIVLLSNPDWPAEDWPGSDFERINATQPTPFAHEVAEIQKRYPSAVTFSMEQIPTADIYRTAGGLHKCWLERLAAESSPIANLIRNLRPKNRQLLREEHRLFTGNPHLHTITISDMVTNEILAEYPDLEPRLHTIHVGYTPPRISPEKRAAERQRIRKELGIPDTHNVILFVGTGWKRKGASILAQAFKEVTTPDTHLVIVGKGKLDVPAPPNTHLTGPVKDATPFYLAADLFCLPSLYDPFANACLEAASFGLPVITYQSVGFSDALIKHPGAGASLALPRDPKPLAKALDQWLAPNAIRNAQAPLQQLSSEFTLENNVQKTIQVLNLVTASRRDP